MDRNFTTSGYTQQAAGATLADVPQSATLTQKAIRISESIDGALAKVYGIRSRLIRADIAGGASGAQSKLTPDHAVFAQEQAESDLSVLHNILDEILNAL